MDNRDWEKTDMKSIAIKISTVLYRQLQALRTWRGSSIRWMADEAIKEWLAKQKKT